MLKKCMMLNSFESIVFVNYVQVKKKMFQYGLTFSIQHNSHCKKVAYICLTLKG